MFVVAIVFYALAGLFLASATVVSLLAPPDAPLEAQYAVLAVAAAIGMIFWLIGSACVRFRDWRGHLGWTLIGAGGMGSVTLVSLVATAMDPAASAALDAKARAALENADPLIGGIVVGAMLALGVALVFLQSRRDARRSAAQSASVEEVFD